MQAAGAPAAAAPLQDAVQKAGGKAGELGGLPGPAARLLPAQAAPAPLPSHFEAALKGNFNQFLWTQFYWEAAVAVFPSPNSPDLEPSKTVQGLWVIFSCEDKRGFLAFFFLNFK